MSTDRFNLNRLSLLIKRQLVVNLKNLLIAFGASFGVLLIIFFLIIYQAHSVPFAPLVSISFVVIFLGGFIFTSIGFDELHSTDKAYQYLTLPATTLEKLASIWILTSVSFVIISLFIVVLVAILGNLFAMIIGANTTSLNLLFSYPILHLLWIYFVIHSIFLLGSCYFKKNNFLKTLLTLFLIGIIISIYSFVNSLIFFGSTFHSFNDQNLNGDLKVFMTNTFPIIIKIVAGYIVAPFFILVSFFVLKERQV